MKLSIEKFNIELARKQMSIQELCTKSGIPRTTIVQVRRGTRNAKPKTIGQIANALGVDVMAIIETSAATLEEQK